MAKLFEEVSGCASCTTFSADILVHFSHHLESQTQTSPGPSALTPLPTTDAHGAGGNAGTPKVVSGESGSACFAPAPRSIAAENAPASPRAGERTTSVDSSTPKRLHSPCRQRLASPESARHAVPLTLRCHSLVLLTQPSLMHALLPNFGKDVTCRSRSDSGDEAISGILDFERKAYSDTTDTQSERSPALPAFHEVTVDDEPEVFLEMVKFVYLNTCQIEHSNVKALLLIADKYNIEDIVMLCLQWMQDHFDVNTFFSFLALRLSHSRLQKLLWQSLLLALRSRRHFTSVIEDQESRCEQLPVSFIESLLGMDDLPVVSEAEVLHFLARWARGVLEESDGDSNAHMSSVSPLSLPLPVPTDLDGMCNCECFAEGGSTTESSAESGSSACDGNFESGFVANTHGDKQRGRSCSSCEGTQDRRRKDMIALLRTFRRSDVSVSIAELEPILQILQLSGFFSGRPPRENAAMDPGFVIYRGVPGVNVAAPSGHGLTPDVVTHAWKGGSVSLGSHDFLKQQEGFKPSTTAVGSDATFPRLWVQISCPSWSHREKRTMASKSRGHSISGPSGLVAEESVSVSSSLMSLPVHEMPATRYPMQAQSQDDWDIGRKFAARQGHDVVVRGSSVPNLSDSEKIEHKVLCTVISGHMRHGIRIGQRERSSIYDIEDLNSDEVGCIGGTPTEIEFELQLSAQAPNHCGICHCALAVLPAGAPSEAGDEDTLFEIPFDASSEEPLHFHITSSHFDSNSSYNVELNWVLRPCARR